jgi:hypothetical protein
MKLRFTAVVSGLLLVMTALSVSAQVLTNDELKKAIPQEYFFAGQKAPVALRNSVGFKTASGKLVLAALVDTSGYATSIKEKYQGLLITETKLTVDGNSLEPGQYGFGFVDNKFLVMNVTASDVFSASSMMDDQVKHAVPLKLEKSGDGYRLYAGKAYVTLKAD